MVLKILEDKSPAESESGNLLIDALSRVIDLYCTGDEVRTAVTTTVAEIKEDQWEQEFGLG